MTVAAFVPNLFDRSRFQGKVTFVNSETEVIESDYDLFVIDLDSCPDIETFCNVSSRTVGFGSHIDKGTLNKAKAIGCDEVLPRSQFFSKMPYILNLDIS